MKEKMMELARDEARKKLDDQLTATDSIDQKIGSILGFVGIASILAFNKLPDKTWAFIFYLVSLICFIISIVLLLFGYRSIRLETGMSIEGYFKAIEKLGDEKDLTNYLRKQVLYLQHALKTNEVLMQEKREYLAYGTMLLLTGVVCCVIQSLFI